MRRIFFIFSLLLALGSAKAVEFEIYQRAQKPLSVALLVRAEGKEADKAAEFRRIVEADWAHSGALASLDPLVFIADEEETWRQIVYADWRLIGADGVLLARLRRDNDAWALDAELHDPFRMEKVGAIAGAKGGLRRLAHMAAGLAFEKLVGVPAHFLDGILYVRRTRAGDALMLRDQDGARPRIVLDGFSLLLSPELDPKSDRIAANIYEGARSLVALLDPASGAREVVAAFPGLNSTPAFSRDGRWIAITRSAFGNVDIYLFDRGRKRWKRLTRHPGIDTSPSFSPDGRWLAFTSNRSGSPQIYRLELATGRIQRVTFEGRYNTSPAWSPTGERIAYVAMKNWHYAIATVRPDGTGVRYLVEGERIESPAWSPNGWMIAFSREEGGTRRVWEVPAIGGEAFPITPEGEDASDPAWMPAEKMAGYE